MLLIDIYMTDKSNPISADTNSLEAFLENHNYEFFDAFITRILALRIISNFKRMKNKRANVGHVAVALV